VTSLHTLDGIFKQSISILEVCDVLSVLSHILVLVQLHGGRVNSLRSLTLLNKGVDSVGVGFLECILET